MPIEMSLLANLYSKMSYWLIYTRKCHIGSFILENEDSTKVHLQQF